ncbi:NAD-dependent epimerase/dehydratase family protein [Fictibacillus iocasae]|uniref:NAD-dependent epimerase/dehydratase family protein n=1 Tax=Fictibacillus iocasae TaxID=2715437 RepID=A0ABW2NWM3_9BACL
MKTKTVLISGADGFIALHLTKMLREHGYKIITATRNKNGNIRMDFCNPHEVALLKISGIDTMIHTVSPNEMLYKTDTYGALAENSAGIHAALDFCVNNNIKNFVYFSSFHVFGMQEGILTESTSPSPNSNYGLSHYTAEQTIQMFDRKKMVNGWIVRPSNLFGVPENLEKFKRWNLIPYAFCREAMKHKTITLLTPGKQLRNFVGINDVCKNILWILEKRPEERIFHAYGNQTISVLQYAHLVQKVAFEIFNLPVHIIYPEGNDSETNFNFTSLYNDSYIKPSDDLKTFVSEMLREIT